MRRIRFLAAGAVMGASTFLAGHLPHSPSRHGPTISTQLPCRAICVVPNVLGESMSAASQDMTAAGFTPIAEWYACGGGGTIYQQGPKGGSFAPRDSNVLLFACGAAEG